MKRLKKDLLKNFSKERVDHMRKVAQVIYADDISRKEETSESAVDEHQVLTKAELQPKPVEIASAVSKVVQPKESKEEYERRIQKELAEDRKKYASVSPIPRIEGPELKKKQSRPISRTPSGKNQAKSKENLEKIVLPIIGALAILLILLILLR